LDLATASFSSSSVTTFFGKGDGTFQLAGTYAVGPNPFYLAEGDFRGDGHPDLLTANFGSNTLSRLINYGHGTFALAVDAPVGSNPTSIAVSGSPDALVLVGNYGSSDVSSIVVNPDGSFQPEQRFASGVSGPNGIALGDFLGDGRPGVLV